MKTQMRQGDLLIELVDDIPKNAKLQNSLVLAYGEVTGHCHRIKDAGTATLFADDDTLFVDTEKATWVIHDEHGPVKLDPGKKYRVTRQREYDASEAEKERRVLD